MSTQAPVRRPEAQPGPDASAAACRTSGIQRTLLALAASCLGVIPLCELISDRGWLVEVWVAMLVVMLPSIAMRLRHPPGALQVWPGVILLALWVTALYMPEHAWLGVIPNGATWTDLGNLLDDLHRTTNESVAPVHSTVAIKLALCVMLGLMAALIDLIAVVGRHGALAGVPLLVIYIVSGAVPRHAVHWVYFVFSAAGFLLLLALDARDDLHTWGHRMRRSGQAGVRTSIALSGQRIAVIAVVAAVVLPLFAPTRATNTIANLIHGSGSKGGGFGVGGGTIDPFVALKGELNQSSTRRLATVTINGAGDAHPFYLRVNVLSQFTGDGWRTEGHGAQQEIADTGFPTVPSADDGQVSQFTAQIEATGLRGNPPVFANPTRVTGLPSATWAPQDALVLGTKLSNGDRYRESVAQPEPSVAALRSAPSGITRQTAQWVALPHLPKQVKDLVSGLIEGKTGSYARARAISDFFTDPANGFEYSLQTATGDSGSDLVNFLNNRIGFCQQYAAAMAVMLRLAQVPARVVLGYTHEPADAKGRFTITTNDAHAWVEAYFNGIGWVPFDPTPLSSAGGTRASALPWAPRGGASASASNAPSTDATQPRAPHSAMAPVQPADTAPQGQIHRSQSAAGWLVPLAVVVVIAVLLLIPWFARTRRRRQRVRSAARDGYLDPLWAELTDTAVDLGYVWSPTRSPRQVERWLRAPAGDADDSLRALATAVERQRYGADPTPPRRDDTRTLIADLHAVAAGLRAGLNRKTRLRARLWPASLHWSPRRGRSRRRHADDPSPDDAAGSVGFNAPARRM